MTDIDQSLFDYINSKPEWKRIYDEYNYSSFSVPDEDDPEYIKFSEHSASEFVCYLLNKITELQNG